MGRCCLRVLLATVALAHGTPDTVPTPTPTTCDIAACPVIQCLGGTSPVTTDGECCPSCPGRPTPAPTTCDIADCPTDIQCLGGALPFIPVGGCCAMCPERPERCDGAGICTREHNPVCVSDAEGGRNITFGNPCMAENCGHNETQWVEGECGAQRCDLGRCRQLRCAGGAEPFTKTGECCPTCPERPVCDKTARCAEIYEPICVSFQGRNRTYENECRARSCNHTESDWVEGACGAERCEPRECPDLMCLHGEPVRPRGDCCARCPERPVCDETICGEMYAPVCVVSDQGRNLTYENECRARSCNHTESDWVEGVCGAQRCERSECPVLMCLHGAAFTPDGECCDRCPERPTCSGTALCAELYDPVCVSGVTYENTCVATNCNFTETDWIVGECEQQCDRGLGGVLRGVLLDVAGNVPREVPRECPVPVCLNGEPFLADGDCCPRCPVPCDAARCPSIQCRGGVEPVTRDGHCCPQCPDPCDLVRCAAAPLCEGGAEPITPDGECCPRCPERPVCNESICEATYAPVCVSYRRRNLTYENTCAAMRCGHEESDWVEGECGAQRCDLVGCEAKACEGGAEPVPKDGKCCPQCPDPCDLEECPFEQCEGGAFPVKRGRECCPSCRGTISGEHASYCPDGFADLPARFSWGLGRITTVQAHQECADRCEQFSGVQYNGGCKGYMTGMYFGMVYCRSYGGSSQSTTCAPWAKPGEGGFRSGAVGSVHSRTNGKNIGGNCCVRKGALTFDGSVRSTTV